MKKIGRTSFSKEGYENFVYLTKEEQIKKIGDGLNPKDYDQAEKLLTRIPHGGISSGNEQEAKGGNTKAGGGNKKNNPARPEADSGESTGV